MNEETTPGVSLAARLTWAVARVCPISGVSVGKRPGVKGEDGQPLTLEQARRTWRPNFKASASEEQRRAAESVIAAFDPDDLSDIAEGSAPASGENAAILVGALARLLREDEVEVEIAGQRRRLTLDDIMALAEKSDEGRGTQ